MSAPETARRNRKETAKAMRALKTILLLTISVSCAAAPLPAAEPPEVLGTFGEWSAFAEGQGASKLCYAASAPVKKEGKYSSRGDVAVLVTDNLSDKTFDVVSVVSGYDFQPKEDVLVQVDEKKFNLFSKGDRAWNSDAAADKAMVAEMKKSSKMLVVGSSNKGTRTTDTYSLSGFGKAYEAITKACPQAVQKPAPKPAKPDKGKK
jgi:hypothetical protein